jgi:TRAP-type mannitol/chloroaromatic compound transport system permease small subunit
VIFERSRETSGIPAVFVLKTLIPAFAIMFALQGVSQAIRAAQVLAGGDAASGAR